MMSSLVALSRPDLVAGTVLMSGRVPAEVRPLLAPTEQLAGKPFLVVHGTQDPVLPVHNGRESRDLLASLPVDLTYKEYPMEHQVSAESLTDVTTWLSARLDGAG
jgi:phospholipase/carboxylesterase